MKNSKNTNDLEVVWGVLCGSSSIDQATNNISLYNVLERLTLTRGEAPIPKGPSPIPLQHEFIILTQRPGAVDKKETYPLNWRIRDPKGAVLFEAPIPAIFESGKKRMRLRIQNNAFPITVAGEYRIEALLDEGEPLASAPLEIVIN